MEQKSTSLSIILKIWIAALLLNTVFGTAVMTDMYTADAGTIGLVALLGLVYGILLTLPLIVLLFVCIRLFLRMDIAGKQLFGLVFATGQFLTVAFVVLFFLMIGTLLLPVWSILIVALGSCSVAILLEYRPIIELRKTKEEGLVKEFLD